MVLETAGLNATELSAFCRERGLFPELMESWRQSCQEANQKPVLTLTERKNLDSRHQQVTWTPKTEPALMRASLPARIGQEKPH